MNEACKGNRRIVRHGWGLLAVGVMGAAMAVDALACVANTNELIDSQTVVYSESFSAGDVITAWSGSSRGEYLEKCPENIRVNLSVVANSSPVSSVDDIPVYATDNPNVGIQFQYQYNPSRRGVGTPVWSPWRNLSTTAESLSTASYVGADVGTEYVGLNYRARFVALRAFSGNQRVGRTRVATVTDETFGINLSQRVFEAFHLDAPRQRSCGFSGTVDGRNIAMPFTHTSSLRKEGDESRAAEFNWSFSCDYGNLGGTEAIGIDYTAGTAAVDAENGRMRVTGGATGVDLQVRRRVAGDMVPVDLRSRAWVRHDAETGTEYLDVRYIRNADPLVPGRANGALKIYIEPW